MALSNWDTLAFEVDGPSHCGAVTNHDNAILSLYKNWLNLDRLVTTTSGPPWRRRETLHEQHEATIYEGDLRIGSWSIFARRGPQNGIYVIAHSARLDVVGKQTDTAMLVGCGVYGYTDPTEAYIGRAIDLGLDPATLMTMSELDVKGRDHRTVVGYRDPGDGLVTVATAVPESEWVGVQPESVNYLKAFVQEHILKECGSEGWPGNALATIPWDESERANQGDLFFEAALGVAIDVTAPGEAETPLLAQAVQDMAPKPGG